MNTHRRSAPGPVDRRESRHATARRQRRRRSGDRAKPADRVQRRRPSRATDAAIHSSEHRTVAGRRRRSDRRRSDSRRQQRNASRQTARRSDHRDAGDRLRIERARSSAAEAPLARARNRRAPRANAGLVEIGPERVDEQQFGIGRLPEQEVGQALLARGADQQVERRQAGGVERGLDRCLVDRVGSSSPASALRASAARRAAISARAP